MHVALLYFTCSILYSFPSQLYSLVEGGTLIGKCLATQHKVIASWTVVSWPGIWHVHPWATPSPPMSTKGWLKIYQLHDFLHFSLTKSCSSILMKLHQASSFLSLFHFMRWDFFKGIPHYMEAFWIWKSSSKFIQHLQCNLICKIHQLCSKVLNS